MAEAAARPQADQATVRAAAQEAEEALAEDIAVAEDTAAEDQAGAEDHPEEDDKKHKTA